MATTSDCPGSWIAYACHDLQGPPGLALSCAYSGSGDAADVSDASGSE